MRVLVTGGGTGGHLYPALAIMESLRSLDNEEHEVRIGYVGAKRGLETRVIPSHDWIEFFPIRIRGFKRKPLCWYNLLAIVELFIGLSQSLLIVLKFRPSLIVGTGGYVSFPPLLWGILFGIPTILHEQNLLPGLTNRLLAGWVNLVLLSYEGSAKFLKTKKVVVTGVPVRKGILKAGAALGSQTSKLRAFSHFGLDSQKKTVLAIGGSRGAKIINESIIECGKLLPDLQFLLVTGEGNGVRDIREGLRRERFDNITVREYIDSMGEALVIADLVVCRAGGATLAEIAALGKPAILIPWAGAVNHHQERNARFPERAGAALVIPEEGTNRMTIAATIKEILGDEGRLEEMGKASLRLGKRDALDRVMEEVEGFINE